MVKPRSGRVEIIGPGREDWVFHNPTPLHLVMREVAEHEHSYQLVVAIQQLRAAGVDTKDVGILRKLIDRAEAEPSTLTDYVQALAAEQCPAP